MASRQQLISADSHVLEPPDLWVQRLDNPFQDRAPKVVPNDRGPGIVLVAPGITSLIAGVGAIGRGGEELAKHMQTGYENFRPSGWDPAERLKDQEIDGVGAEVLYPGLGMLLYGLEDVELQQACFRAYNDWLAEFCSHSPAPHRYCDDRPTGSRRRG